MELLAKIFSHVRKRLHLKCLTVFWMCPCCVRDNYLSVNFSTQPFLLLSSLWWFKFFIFQLFRFSMKLMKPIHLHYNWQQNRVGKMGDIFQPVRPYVSTWCQNIKKNEITWSMYFVEPFLYYQVFLMKKYAW